jgi:glutamate racemase
MLSSPKVLVFDSGLGGLTVYAELLKALPDAHYVYVADDAAFPYGRLAPDVLIARVDAVMNRLIKRFRPDIVVIACNTASTICLPSLRAHYDMPFVGTVPAVKPAALLSKTRIISILGTPGTVSREYTHDLIIAHAADCRVSLVGAPNLARYAEGFLRGEAMSDAAVLAEILPCFKEKEGVRTDAIALACTHYPLLLDIYKRIAPWEVIWVDPAPAIARRMTNLLSSSDKEAQAALSTSGKAYFTAGNTAIASSLQRTLAGYGLLFDKDDPFEDSFQHPHTSGLASMRS